MDNISNFFKTGRSGGIRNYSGFHVDIIKSKSKKTRQHNIDVTTDTSDTQVAPIIPIIRKSQADILNDWLDEHTPSKYMNYDREGISIYEFFNHDFTTPSQENNYIEPYTYDDIDVKNSSIYRHSDEYSAGMSDFYQDREVLFIPGSRRCSANLFYKNMLIATHNYNTTTPSMTFSSEGIEYFNEDIPIMLDKEQVYKMLMKMSNT